MGRHNRQRELRAVIIRLEELARRVRRPNQITEVAQWSICWHFEKAKTRFMRPPEPLGVYSDHKLSIYVCAPQGAVAYTLLPAPLGRAENPAVMRADWTVPAGPIWSHKMPGGLPFRMPAHQPPYDKETEQ